MDVSVKAILVSAIWTVFWLFVSTSFKNADPVKWSTTSYGTFPAAMYGLGFTSVLVCSVWFVVTL